MSQVPDMLAPADENIPTGEFGLIEWIRRRTASLPKVRLGIGDDAAEIDISADSGSILVATDMLIEGRHFTLDTATPRQVGYKAMGVNLSDIAAMAGKPIAAFVSVALPRSHGIEIARELYLGLEDSAREHQVAIAGGDTNSWHGPLVCSVTIVGEPTPPRAVTRRGAKPGDHIFVTGSLGGSLKGRHLSPVPRIKEARSIHRLMSIHAMIDISDGLTADLGHILEESGGLGAILDADSIPIHADAIFESARDGRTPLEHALGDGEDFELCFTVDPADSERLRSESIGGFKPIPIGVIRPEPGIALRSADGSIRDITPKGFDHFEAK